MLIRMKTTIDLPDELYVAAKKRAVEERRPMRDLIEQGLRSRLAAKRGPRARRAKPIRWVTVHGGLPAGLDVADRTEMYNWLRTQ